MKMRFLQNATSKEENLCSTIRELLSLSRVGFGVWTCLEPGSDVERCLERLESIEESVFYSVLRDSKIGIEEFDEIFTVFANHPRGPNFPYEAQCSALYEKMRKAGLAAELLS